ncbi:unnamed protein product, partial [Schistosoma margrebowiei]
MSTNIQESRLEKLLTFVGTTLHIQLEISTIFFGRKTRLYDYLVISRLQRELRELEAQREDQEARIATLEQRYLATQRE